MRKLANFPISVGTVLIMAIMIAVETLPIPALGYESIDTLRRTVRKRGLNAEARDAELEGYYQDLLNSAGDTRGASAVDLLMQRDNDGDGARAVHEVVAMSKSVPPINDFSPDYVIYRPKPHLDLPDPRFAGFRHITNSLGFADRDYDVARPAGTRRVVMIGDSIARGLGTPNEQRFDSLVEDQLNRSDNKFELINLSVSGYRLTQMIDVALESAPQFTPDVYVLALTELSISRRWDLHILQAFDEGRDLKYDFIRKVVADARLQAGNPPSTSHAKLAPFMVPTLKWVLGEMRQKAAGQQASVVVLFMPTLRETGELDRSFRPIRTMLAQEGIPYINLLDAFDNVDLKRIDAGDGGHPNALGHSMMAELFLRKLQADPALQRLLLGESGLPGNPSK